MGPFTQLLRSVFDLSKRNFTELWTKTFISQNILYVVLGSVALYRLTCCRRTMRKGFLWNYIEPTFNHSVNTSQRNLEEAYSLIIAIDQTLITLFMQRLLEDILIWVLRIWKITGRSRNWKSLHFEQQPNQLHGRHLYLSYLSSKVEMARTAGWELKAIICMWNVQKRSHPSERKQMLRHRDLQRLRWQEQQDGNWKSSTDSSTLFPFSTWNTTLLSFNFQSRFNDKYFMG